MPFWRTPLSPSRLFLLEVVRILNGDLIGVQGTAGPAPHGVGLCGSKLGQLLGFLHRLVFRAAFHVSYLLIEL